MNSSTFRTIPKARSFAIPFKLKENSLLEWLLGLHNYSAQDACSRILQLLQALNKVDLSAKTRLSFLITIHDYLKQYINKLEGSCWNAHLPLSTKEQAYADAVIWNYITLADNFFIAAQDGIKTEEIFALYMSCYCLGQAQLHMAAVYAIPSEGFWQLTYKVFAWSEKRKLLHTPIDEDKLKEITLQPLFAQMFIFHACDTNQFRARDMRTIFNFLPKVCHTLKFYKLSDLKFQTEVLKIPYLQAMANNFGKLPEKLLNQINEREDLLVFDLNKDLPPNVFNSTHSLHETSLRYLTAESVVESLVQIIANGETWSGVLKSINHELFGRVIKTLEPGKKRRHARAQAGYTMLGIVGFESIISFLYKVNNKNNLKAKPVQAPASVTFGKTPSTFEELKLYAANTQQMGAIDGGFESIDFSYPSSSESAIWENYKKEEDITKKAVSLKKMNIFDSSAWGYSVYWVDDENSKAKVGDVFAIISEDKKRLEIAIVRRIAMFGAFGENNYRFGSEILGFESEAVILTSVENQGEGGWTIFIPANKAINQPDSVIYQIGNFQLGNCVYVYRQNKRVKATLAREINVTASVAHVELDYLIN